MKLCLQALQPPDQVQDILIDKFPFVIGRRSDSDYALPLAFISRHHCQFMVDGNQVLVQDLESYNGTFVNGRPASPPLPVAHGDEISLGPVSFRVVMQAGAQDTAEACRGPARGETAQLTPIQVRELPSGNQ